MKFNFNFTVYNLHKLVNNRNGKYNIHVCTIFLKFRYKLKFGKPTSQISKEGN